MNNEREERLVQTGRSFYRIIENGDGTADILLKPGFGIDRACIVRGVNPDDPAFCGGLEAHIRAHYAAWLEIGEVINL